jgi:hypothetical protein
MVNGSKANAKAADMIHQTRGCLMRSTMAPSLHTFREQGAPPLRAADHYMRIF